MSAQTTIRADLAVLGSGPGGYTAAFRAADLGMKTVLIERYSTLGGVCLNVGCIPSKALLHAAKVISAAREAAAYGIEFGAPNIDRAGLLHWKDKLISRLTGGLQGLAGQRKVSLVQGTGQFVSPDRLTVDSGAGRQDVVFEKAIIAVGSRPTSLPATIDDPRVMDATGALALATIPSRLLVIGAGIIGLEMAAVYHELGSSITVVELLDELMNDVDPDLVKPLHKRIARQYGNIYPATRVTAIRPTKNGLSVGFSGPEAPAEDTFDRVLVAIGRQPNGNQISASNAGIDIDERGFIPVDDQQRTNVANIFAVGDVTGPPLLAHKASHEGRVAAEVAAGQNSAFAARVVPSVAYTDPEIAWVGVTEAEAKAQGLNYGKGVFPWAASGRSLSLGRSEGLTKLLFDEQTQRIIGAGIVGSSAGDLIAELTLAIEMDCTAEDIGLTIHPHPTLSETVAFSADVFAGTITDLYVEEDRRRKT